MSLPGTVGVRVGFFASRLPYPVNLNLPPISQPDLRQNPRTVGPELDVVVPQDDVRHTKLGRFMDSWSLLESTLPFLLADLLQIEKRDALLTLPKLGMRNAIDLLNGLGMRKLVEADAAVLTNLTERLSRMNTKRNVLVHGEWVYEANVLVRRGEAILICQFFRLVTPTDPKEAKAMGDPRNQRERVRYSFTLKRCHPLFHVPAAAGSCRASVSAQMRLTP
jgi:hypothetical protein